MAATSARDLLPLWLVRHDELPSTASSNSNTCTGSSSSSAAAAGASQANAPRTLPPSHITMVPWDDGFTPSNCGGKPGKIIRDQQRSSPGALRVIDCAVSYETADQLYASAVRAKVWGVYVPTAELDLSRVVGSDGKRAGASGDPSTRGSLANDAAQRPGSSATGDRVETEEDRRALARRAVQELLVDRASIPQQLSPVATTADSASSASSTSSSDVISASDWDNTHGVAVWVIASDCDDETEYHLDYAETVRFETNVIIPPLYGATLHVSPLRNRDVRVWHDGSSAPHASAGDGNGDAPLPEFEGGAFYVNRNGLAHYARYGYKTRLLERKVSTDTLEAASGTEHGWTRVPYLYRRGIVCDGEFPHFSGRVRSLPDAASVAAAYACLGDSETTAALAAAAVSVGDAAAPSREPLAVKRVVVGFNLFPHEIGAFVQQLPEHSAAFNRHVKLAQVAAKQIAAASIGSGTRGVATAIGENSCGTGASADTATTTAVTSQTWSLESVRANPKQAAFIRFLAKKMREKGVDITSLRSGGATTTATGTGVDAAHASAAVAPTTSTS